MKNKLLVIFFLFVFVVQCSKDDEADSLVIRDYNEQVQVDQELLENFMQTHTYKNEDFNNQLNFDIKIDYLEIRKKNNLKSSLNIRNSKIFIAYFINKVRLIDNF